MFSASMRTTRRRFVKMGTLGLAGLTLPRLLWADAHRAKAGTRAPADACILVFLNGGPSHLDMWDPKPEAPPEIRGEFKAIATSQPGVMLSEHLPGMARHMHRSVVIRSANHRVGCSTTTQRAFQLSQEPDQVRAAYGRNIYGQSVLLARRLIEAGTRVVTVAWAPDANATWDTHWDHVNRLKNELLPPLDMALASLLDDLVDRGMFERTLVVVMGEFGRTPKITPVPGYPLPGRSHWPFCYSLWMAGGPLKRGFVYGASDKIGAYPDDKPVIPAEIIATIYHALGIPNTYEFRDALDRPVALVPWGDPIMEMFA